ncbi:MAG TPA: bifunctional phosphoglucose/phosphomannose isomerase [Actinomycetota bacterium]|nr:bifunctional phosphoglucose/phosphomannose isomerase [Actinomycetota bacterium]
MIDLDDEEAMTRADPGGMLDAVTALPDHCRGGYRAGRNALDLPDAEGVTSILVVGMGGSAVAGDVLAALASPRVRIPVQVVRGGELPEHCGIHTLVIASSYSGTTAETLAAFEEAVRRGCRLLAITSGGELARRAEELELGRITVPTGYVPRAAFGFLTLGVLGALEAMGVVPAVPDDLDEAVTLMREVLEESGPVAPTARNPAKDLARAIGDRVPVVWGAEGIGSVAATRWKTQFNENAKVPAFASAIPELDHNEVVGWSAGRGEGFALIALRHDGEPADVAARFPPSIEIARGSGATVREVGARGRSALARLLTLTLQGDLSATYLGIARGEDPSPIDAIAGLKRALAGS